MEYQAHRDHRLLLSNPLLHPEVPVPALEEQRRLEGKSAGWVKFGQQELGLHTVDEILIKT